jgi:methylmalonyl-CoA/ethylmalonyl-CoA epimerase
MFKRIDHIGVIVDDLEGAQRILGDLLGLEISRTAENPAQKLRALFFRCGGIDVEVIQIDDPGIRDRRLGPGPARIEHIAFEVDDLDAAQRDLASAGVRMTTEEPVRTEVASSYFTEAATTDGIMLQLMQRHDR